MHPVRKFYEMMRLYWAGRVGDSALIKFDLYGLKPSEACTRALAEVDPMLPPVDLEALRRMPEDSLGRAYARFLDEHGIRPIVFHPETRAAADPFALRYMTTHDLIHTLLGFDTTFAGEVGVFAATVEQGMFRDGEWWLRISDRLMRVVLPLRWREIAAARERGRALGRRAAFLLTLPFERLWDRPLAEVRREVGVA